VIIHTYTCECGEQFRSRNKAYAEELHAEHRDEVTAEQNNGVDQDRLYRLHDGREHTSEETPDIVPTEPLWSPAQGS
jgi:hypothetical protein